MSTPEELLAQYEGQIVPRSFNAGFVTLSYVVSFIGAASTLELINRRTSRNGLFNHIILFSASVTMGGIAIWCMHFIGNRAIDLGIGEPALQIVYSSSFTALSFFLPIFVLLAAFLAVGTNNKVSWWRIVVGGALAGGAICGMHYLGNASIDNYNCVYNTVNVVGAALIAVAASIVSLALFFVFRAAWTASWWKRGLCAIVLAGAVSGMHWCASTGTQYRLIRVNTGSSNQLSRNMTVIVVICLSVGAALIMAVTAIYTARVMRRYADKAQHVVLAAAVFDQDGRILVNPDGLLPSERITDTYIEKTVSDHFSIAHPLFHWMFRASRNWSGMSKVIHSMSNHVAHLRKVHHDGKVRLIDDDGQLVENYDIIFREMFCLAASDLADKLKERVEKVGILWDEILPTGSGLSGRQRLHSDSDAQLGAEGHRSSSAIDGDVLVEKGEGWRARQQEYGRGSLMFLVRRLTAARDVEKLEAAGFRFAEVNQVSGIIGTSMQIKTRNLGSKLNNMASYADENTMMEPGVHISFFGVRARVGGHGFDVLVRRGARNLLPSVQMPLEHLESWQMEFIRQLDRLNVPQLCQKLDGMKELSPREMVFASHLYDTIEALRAWLDSPVFDDAVLTAKVVQAPCRPPVGSSSTSTCTVVTLKMVIPIHVNLQNPKCEFVPVSFFKVHQLVYKESPHHAAFSQSVHRDISPVLNAIPLVEPSANVRRRSSFFRFKPANQPKTSAFPVDADGHAIPTNLGRRGTAGSTHSGSTIKLLNGANSEMPQSDAGSERINIQRGEIQHAEMAHPPNTNLGGIMISQEIKVDVREANEASDVGRRYSIRPNAPAGQTSGNGTSDLVTIVSSGHNRANPSRSEIEMQSMPESGGEVVHSGPAARSAMIESGRAGEAATFVDELFAACLDGR